MIEAEIKARLVDPDVVRHQLDEWATGVPETYSDTYFDAPGDRLEATDRELRIRTALLADLGITESEQTTDTYTDAVRTARTSATGAA